MSSISQLTNVYAQNVKEIPEYYAALDDGKLPTERGYRLNQDDHIRRYVITKIMCDFELDKRHIERKYDLNFDDYFGESLVDLEPFVLDGLVELSDNRIDVTDSGRLLIRNIVMTFDAYLLRHDDARPMYSKTV
jgi:oxygen-independent coproporphyrinogen-3 oxidase